MDLVDILNKIYLTETKEQQRFVSAFEGMYFGYIRSPFKILGLSEDFKLAKDIVRLNHCLEASGSVRDFRAESKHLKSNPLLTDYRNSETLQSHEIEALRIQLIQKNRHLVAAAMIADRFRQERARESFRWLIALLVSVLSAIAALLVKSLS